MAGAHGLKLYSEAYGGRTFDEFQCAEQSDVNMGEVLQDLGRSPGRIKMTASLVRTPLVGIWWRRNS